MSRLAGDRLAGRDDFPELVALAAEHHAIPSPAIVEKDYFVTEALRAIADRFPYPTIFKGGTSLSKGWGLIERFSEDIDLYVDTKGLSEKARKTRLRELVPAVSSSELFGAEEVVDSTTFGRSVRFPYASRYFLDGMPTSVLLEAGVQSGTYPTERRSITSLLGAFLDAREVERETEDRWPFEMTILHFRRTFVEKCFALHHYVAQRVIDAGRELGTYARHYYDLSRLIATPEVRAMLSSDEFGEIVRDYVSVTRQYFPNQRFPADCDLSTSPALFPDADLALRLRTSYDRDCARLCYGRFPSFEEVLGAFEANRRSFAEFN